MKRFPRGSEWRKWDLHVHAPGTKLNDGYTPDGAEPDWDRFCKTVHDSDVCAFGITDYFSLDGFFAFRAEYDRRYPESDKVFFPNLELRLNETVNRAVEQIDFHVIFAPDLTLEKAGEFLRELKTQRTDGSDRKQPCSELQTRDDYQSASVSRDDIKNAIELTFGKKALGTTDRFILVAPANNNGMRPDTGNRRKMILSDEVDKLANAVFGNPGNVDYFLDVDRLEGPDEKVAPKPVFAGCDAHCHEDLESWLGEERPGPNEKHPTWVKADLTFEGLQQTLIEPSERVRIQSTVPDKKEPYKVISRIIFTGTDDFPAEVVFNSGLNAIIGSRSSGKSALLAYIAHAVDFDYAVRQQVAAGMEESEAGPGASVTWADVKDLNYSVEWESPLATMGRVIYIPQNSLYQISEHPSEITAKIRPTVFRSDADFEAEFRKAEADVVALNDSIRSEISDWYALSAEIRASDEELRSLGDRKAILNRRDALVEQIGKLQRESALTSDEVAQYQNVMDGIGKNDTRLDQIEDEIRILGQYVKPNPREGVYETTDQVAVDIKMTPSPTAVPDSLESELDAMIREASRQLLEKVKAGLSRYRTAVDKEREGLVEANAKLRLDNAGLIDKSVANTRIATLVSDLKDQKDVLAEVDKKAALIKTKSEKQRLLLISIEAAIVARDRILNTLSAGFNKAGHQLEQMIFAIEVDHDPEDLDRVSGQFNKNAASPYIDRQKQIINMAAVLAEPGKFIERMNSGEQKLNRGANALSVTQTVLAMTRDIRFTASLEGDRIGGFRKSSMTPGKQALFALTLILAESGEPWPLLIDQPEDDLDSRSVCDVIVKDLMRRKRERQVIMVSHNANLVIGADSEEIIVANRHGEDRKNAGGKKFAYLTGSLEYSKAKDSNEGVILESAGIREHACDILDGGEEAFQKRKDKYRI